VEETHIHVDNHINFVFHAMRGALIAVAAYPLRDQFAFVDKQRGGIVQLHGHVRFFNGETFNTAAGVKKSEPFQFYNFKCR
jgi:hypothetical protein